jgi:hypothetical protein
MITPMPIIIANNGGTVPASVLVAILITMFIFSILLFSLGWIMSREELELDPLYYSSDLMALGQIMLYILVCITIVISILALILNIMGI